MQTIKLYGTTSCMQCKSTENFLNKKNINFEKIDLEETPNAIDYLSSIGYKSIPVIEIMEENNLVDSWSGFRPDKISSIL